MNYLFCAFFCVSTSLFAQFSVINPVKNYGWLDQYSMDSRHDFVGNEACVPTSSTNAMTYLQNTAPQIFEDALSGTTYSDWEATDDLFIKLMGTKKKVGTYYYQFVYALHTYLTKTKDHPQAQFSGLFPSDTWYASGGYPQPSYIKNSAPNISFLTNSIASGSAVLLSIEYSNGGGHEILVNGIEWDPILEKGKIYFVDPLDPSENYSEAMPLGPVKQTVGELRRSDDGTHLILTYQQYDGRLPFKNTYDKVEASLLGVLSVAAAPFIPFSERLESGNSHAIALGFDKLNPITPAMFPVMAVFNTLSNDALKQAFKLLDPALYSSILFSQQNAALSLNNAIMANIDGYRSFCHNVDLEKRAKLWAIPYKTIVRQRGTQTLSGYNSFGNGWTIGIDYLLDCYTHIGIGFSRSKNSVYQHDMHAKADIKSYGGFIYGAKIKSRWFLDGAIAVSQEHVKSKRSGFIASPIPVIAPLIFSLKQNNISYTLSGYVRASYTAYSMQNHYVRVNLWPYITLFDCNAWHPHIKEQGNAIFALVVDRKSTNLFQPEIGLGKSIYFDNFDGNSPFLHLSLGYLHEFRFAGRETQAYFAQDRRSKFSVRGLYPKQNIFCPRASLGVKSPDDYFQLQACYEGRFGSKYSFNQVQVEASFSF